MKHAATPLQRPGRPLIALICGALLIAGGAMTASAATFAKSPPTGLHQVDKTGTSITVGWNATSGANLYYVRYGVRGSSSTSTVSSTSTSRNITGLKPNTWYDIQVRSASGTTASHTLLSDYSTPVQILTREFTFNPPGGLKADYATRDRVGLSWSFVNNADSYKVRITGPGSAQREIRVKNTDTLRRISSDVTGLVPGKTYKFAVRALEQKVDPGTGDYYPLSDWSGDVTQATPADDPGSTVISERPPEAPGLTTISSSSLGFSWKPATGTQATGYRIQVRRNSDAPVYLSRPTNAATSVKFTGSIPTDTSGVSVPINDGDTYRITVAALKSGASSTGIRISGYSDDLIVTPRYLYEPPANLRLVGAAEGDRFTVAWDAVQDAARYRVTWAKSNVTSTNCSNGGFFCDDTVTGTSKQITDVEPGATYLVRVSTINASGETISNYQPIALEVPTVSDLVPGIKQIPNATSSASTVTMQWDANVPKNSSVTTVRYETRYSTDQKMASPQSGPAVTNGLTAKFTGLIANKLYFIQVRAVYSDGTKSEWGTVADAFTRSVVGSISGQVNGGARSQTLVAAYDKAGDLGGIGAPNSSGAFTIEDLPPGDWYLRYSYLGEQNFTSPWLGAGGAVRFYESQAGAVNVSSAGSDTSVPTMTAPAGISISGAVTGTLCKTNTRVTALSDNKSVSGAKDTVMADGRTDSSGKFTLHGLPKNEGYWLRFTGLTCGTQSVQVLASQTSQDVTGVDTRFEATGNGIVSGLNSTEVTSAGATISWQSYPGAVKYRVYWSYDEAMSSSCGPRCHVTSSAASSVSLASILKGNPAGGNTVPTAGKTYHLKVSAIASSGKTITTWQDQPLTVTLPSASSSSITIHPPSNVTADDAQLNWKTVPGAASYRIYWSTSASMPSRCEPTCRVVPISDIGGDATTASTSLASVVGTLRAGEKYYLKISAVNSAGRAMTGWQANPTPVDLVGTPEVLPTTVQGLSVDANQLVSWEPFPSAARYRVYWSASPSMASACSPRCHVITAPASSSTSLASILSGNASGGNTTPTPGKTYYVKISAISGAGKTISGWQGTPLRVDVPDPSKVDITAPTDVTAADATVNWKGLDGAAEYRIYWSTSASMPGRCEPTCREFSLTELGGSASTPSISLASVVGNIRSGGVYYVKISAINSSGKTISGWQEAPTMVDLSGSAAQLPGVVGGISYDDGTLTWDAVPTATRYRVYVTSFAPMPSRCEPYCDVVTPQDRAHPSVELTGSAASPGRKYVKVSAITTEGGRDRTITGWQSVPYEFDASGT